MALERAGAFCNEHLPGLVRLIIRCLENKTPRRVRTVVAYMAALTTALYFLENFIPQPISTVVGGHDTVPFLRWPSAAQFSHLFRVDSLAQLKRLLGKLRLPDRVRHHGYVARSIDALAVTLCLLAYPKRQCSVRYVLRLQWSVSKVSAIFNKTCQLLMDTWGEMLEYDHRVFRNPQRLAELAQAVSEAGCPFDTFFGFIDSAAYGIARPSGHGPVQNAERSGHERSLCPRWQGVTTPDGMIVAFYGPIQGK